MQDQNIKVNPHDVLFEDAFESMLKAFVAGMVFACSTDKVSFGHAVSPATDRHGRNLSAFLYHLQ